MSNAFGDFSNLMPVNQQLEQQQQQQQEQKRAVVADFDIHGPHKAQVLAFHKAFLAYVKLVIFSRDSCDLCIVPWVAFV